MEVANGITGLHLHTRTADSVSKRFFFLNHVTYRLSLHTVVNIKATNIPSFHSFPLRYAHH